MLVECGCEHTECPPPSGAQLLQATYTNMPQVTTLSDSRQGSGPGLTFEDLFERVAVKADYKRLIAPILPLLRDRNDASPQMIDPYVEGIIPDARVSDPFKNTWQYLQEHPEAEPVKCFRVWISNKGSVSAIFHMLPFTNGKYVEVTPPETGDEGQRFMIVPSSRVYGEWSAREMIDLHVTRHLRLRFGGVFFPEQWVVYQKAIRGEMFAEPNASRLALYACPYMTDLPTYVPRDVLERVAILHHAGRVMFGLNLLLKVIDAKRWLPSDKAGCARLE